MSFTFLQAFISFLPIVSISIFGKLFPIKQSYKPIFQPPDWVFPIIWSYNTLSLGFITNQILKTHNNPFIYILYFSIVFCLNYWLYLNSKSKIKKSFYLLVVTTYLSILYCIFLTNYSNLSYVLLPLPLWLTLASCLNGVIYDRLELNI